MRRTLGILALALAVALSTIVSVSPPVAAAARVVDGRSDDWIGASSGIGGTTQLSLGEVVYQDHVYDDLGPDTGARARQHGTTGAPDGDYRYPEAPKYAHNAADLLELRLTADDRFLYLLARLNTLVDATTTVVAVGFDTGANATFGDWPFGAGIRANGADVVATLRSGAASLMFADGARRDLAPEDVAVDSATNVVEARLPLDALGLRDTTETTVWAATGLWDGDEWMAAAPQPSTTEPGGGVATVAARAWNVAFRGDERGSFFEESQAAALKTGDITKFGHSFRLDEMRRGATGPPATLVPGTMNAIVLDTGFAIGPGEGVSYDGVPGRFPGLRGAALSQKYSFLGTHQPYALYVPTTHDAVTPGPAALVLHGLGGSHNSYNGFKGFMRDMGEGAGPGSDRPPLYLITPLARGSSFYADYGEAETLRVLDDAFARVPIDAERLYLTGYSMGGYGVYRLGSLYPDLFARAAVWAGYSGEFTGSYLTEAVAQLNPLPPGENANMGKASIGDPVQTMENLRHLPLVLLSGTNDEIVPTSGQAATVHRLDELGYRSRWDVYPGYEHFAFGVVDDWKQVRTWLGNERRVRQPRDITYRFSDAWVDQTLAGPLGIVHGNAWWLRDLTMRDDTPDDPTTPDAFTLATADAESFNVVATQMDVDRPDPVVADAPTPHVQKEVRWRDTGVSRPLANKVRIRLERVSSARVDTAAAGLTVCGLVVELTTDGPSTVVLRGASSPAARIVATGAGAPTATTDPRGRGVEIRTAGPYAGSVTILCPPR